jgi:hypothetical protein
MEELNDRRQTMANMSRESGQQRDSLLAATAQVAALKAQLDRAVEQKVNKKLNNRLKVGLDSRSGGMKGIADVQCF